MQATAQDLETLDELCMRITGRTAGVVESALAANPGLAELGPVLPLGTAVRLPAATVATQTETALVQLWN